MRLFGFVCAAMLIVPVAVGAQATDDQTAGIRRERIERALNRLNPGTPVRVRSRSGISNGVIQPGEGLARLNPPLEADTIEEMWKRSGSAGRGALIGGGVGGITLGGLGALLAWGLCENQDGCLADEVGIGIYGFGIGAAGGALLGAGLGSLVKRWVRIYPNR